MTVLVVIEAVVILLLLVLMAGLLRSHAEILRQLHRLGADARIDRSSGVRLQSTGFEVAPALEIDGIEPSGTARRVSLRHGRGETLLAFLTSGCASCRIFWDAFDGDIELPTPDTRPVIVTKGTASESPGTVAGLAPSNVPVVMSDDAWDTFRVPLTPYFMLIDGKGKVIGEGSASSWNHLVDILTQSLQDTRDPVHLDTADRERYTDERLSRSGVEPGDPSLYTNPLEQ